MSSSTNAPSPPPTLLFVHGGGFCKEVWTPVIERLQQTPLLQRAAPHTNIISFDLPYHAANRDVSEPSRVYFDGPTSPRVSHRAMHWTTWAVAAVRRQVQLVREKQGANRAPIIGIGHSMGAAALWGVEAASPGTFDGLILFEPMANTHEYPMMDKRLDFLVALTLKRKASWNSREEAEKELLAMKNFARWDREALKSYIKGGVVKVDSMNNVLDPHSMYALACHPHIEASLYCGGTLTLSDDEIARIQCPVTFHYGERSQLFFPEYQQPIVDKYPHLYRLGKPVPKTTHTLVMEDPATVTSRIIDSLKELEPFSSVAPDSRL